MRSSSSSTFTSFKWTLTGSCGRQRLLQLEFASAPRGVSGSGCCFGRRARACGSFAGGALFWAFCHIYYTTAVTTRAARWKQAGRPLQGTAFPSQWTGSSPVVGWGSSSAQGETAVTPVFDSDTCVSRVFLPFSAAWGAGYAQAPCSRTCLSFPPTGSLFLWCCFSSHPPAVTSYDVTAPTPHGLGPAAPLLVALSFGHSAIFTILLQ